MPGTSEPLIIIGDSDGLIAIVHQDDQHHNRATETVRRLLQHDAQVIFPITCIAETITTLTRKLAKPKLAAHVVQQIAHGELAIESVNTPLLETALTVFDPLASKQNTLFDAFVFATAKKFGAKGIFSFDEWHKKQGLHLASDLMGV